MKTFVLFEAADAEQEHIAGLQPELAAQGLCSCGRVGSIALRRLDGVRNDANDVFADAKVCDDRSHERPVSGDHAVGTTCCAPNRQAQGPVPKALQRSTGRIRRAEFFEALW